MRVLFVSGELIAGDLAMRLQAEGCDVRLYIEHPRQRSCLDGFVPKTLDWKADLAWVGKGGLIVFDDVGFGAEQDRLRAIGFRVVGGSAGGDRLELDRTFAQQVFADCGMASVPVYNFDTADDAIRFVKTQGGAWVIKQNDHRSHLNYVGMLNDSRDVIGVLENYQSSGITNLSLQRKLNGIEIGVGRYFNGNDWVGPIELNLEHKGLMNQEIGPKTGEMGTLMWHVDSSRLFDETLARLKDYLQNVDFRGDVDINCFVDEEGCYPIEATARFGCPSTHLQSVLFTSPWRDLLCALADGQSFDLNVRSEYGIILTMAMPPFPYTEEIDAFSESRSLPVLFSEDLTSDEINRLHFEGVVRKAGTFGEETHLANGLGYALFISGTGQSVKEAQGATYDLARKIIIPKVMYRTDIGDRFHAGDQMRLSELGYIEKMSLP